MPMDMRALIIVGLAAALLAILGAGLTGLVTYGEDEGVVIADDSVRVPSASLTECCIFLRDGQNRTCAVISPYDCGYCEAYCG